MLCRASETPAIHEYRNEWAQQSIIGAYDERDPEHMRIEESIKAAFAYVQRKIDKIGGTSATMLNLVTVVI